ncbi:MAG: restriction endonuclease subunit S, partial [bacterium]
MSQLDFIELTNAFKYSINLRYDIGDINKINSFIPTRKNLELFKDIFSSFKKNPVSRSRILIGAYGTGKSYFSMILGSILSDKNNQDKYNNLLNKIEKIDNNLKVNIENEIKNKDPYLLVMPTVNNKSFTQAMLNGLKKSLDKNNIEKDVFPKTNFQAVKDKINQWKKEYPATYDMFVEKLENERGYSIDDFSKSISNFEHKAYDLFEEWYPDLTAGGEFDPYLSSDLTEIYTEVNKEIRKLGYKGIFVIYDEFNKLLENNIENFDGIALQDFA